MIRNRIALKISEDALMKTAALFEATRFIPGLKADPVQPTAEEIRALLRVK
ncbi:hypothetical protein KA005_80855 [bacterium]|nr:hypothetical protein [bacterium]